MPRAVPRRVALLVLLVRGVAPAVQDRIIHCKERVLRDMEGTGTGTGRRMARGIGSTGTGSALQMGRRTH